jgi:hypothetical protein
MNSIKIIIGGFIVGLMVGGCTTPSSSVNYLCYCYDVGGGITWRSRPLVPNHSADCKNRWVAAGGNPDICPDKNPWP